jgi:hypothetical protein
MRISLRGVSAVLALALVVPSLAAAQTPAQPAPPAARAAAGKLPSIEDKTAGFTKMDGYFPLYWDETAGTLWMEIPAFNTEVLYVSSLSAGLGSNDIGLDRGQLGGEHVVSFERVGPKILMIEPNLAFRATSNNLDERQSVKEAFGRSTLWGFTAAAETGGRVLVDTTDFLLRDVHGVAARLRPAAYRVDRSRSAVNMARTKAFPKNSEMDVTLTFITDGPAGRGGGPGQVEGRIGDVTPSAEAITVGQHHSIVELPGPGYEPREFDPRSGFFGITYRDYSAPLGESMTKRFAGRHRLKKKDPRAAVSEAVEPIIYYLDRGTPEPIRSALMDGMRYWNQAYEAAGYRNAFQVELMPEGADMMDVRYNVVQWVHRSTRGWSYGSSVSDPRTGEIIKGHVSLDSLRVRQDYMIAEGLLSPYADGTEAPPELARMALARVRQLGAHEVGHTLGIAHQYYNSRGGRISVMDYPNPLVTLKGDGTLDLSDAYEQEIGEWDKVAITWGYQDFPDGTNEKAALDKIIADAEAQDLRFMSNQDMAVSPQADQWAQGTDVTAELERTMQVRRVAMSKFGERAIQKGMPLATLEEVLVPLYLHPRYQIEAAASAIGGQRYRYALRGYPVDDPVSWVSASEQRAALDTILSTIRPGELALPRAVLDSIPPRPGGYGRTREMFPRFTGGAFDPIAPAMSAAQHAISQILDGQRAARLVAQHAVDPALPSLTDVLTRIVTATFDGTTANPYEAEIARATQSVVVEQIMALAGSAAMPQVRAEALQALVALGARAGAASAGGDAAKSAHNLLLASDIKRFVERPLEPVRMTPLPEPPPGAPIGDSGMWYLRCDLDMRPLVGWGRER